MASGCGSKAALAAASARSYLAGLINTAPQQAEPGQLQAALSQFAQQTQAWLWTHAEQAEIFFSQVPQAADFNGALEEGPSLRRSLRSLFTLARASGDLSPQADVEFLADGYAWNLGWPEVGEFDRPTESEDSFTAAGLLPSREHACRQNV